MTLRVRDLLHSSDWVEGAGLEAVDRLVDALAVAVTALRGIAANDERQCGVCVTRARRALDTVIGEGE